MRHRSFQLGMLLTLLCVGGLVLSAIHFGPTLKSRMNEIVHGEFSQQITTATGGEITLKSGTIITFPSNALDKDTVVTVRELPPTEIMGKGPTDAELIAPAVDVMLNEAQLRVPVTVTFSLTTGIPDTSNSLIYMAHRDDKTGLWAGIPATINHARGTISGSVSHFSVVGLFSTTVGKITSAVLHVLEEADKIKTGFTFHANVTCSEPSEMWRMTADHPKLVAGCIERGPDNTDVVRLYNNEIYPQEVHLGHLRNLGVSYPVGKPDGAEDSIITQVFIVLGLANPEKTLLPGRGMLTLHLQPNDAAHIEFTTAPSPFVMAVQIITEVLLTRGLIVGDTVTKVANVIKGLAECVVSKDITPAPNLSKKLISAFPVCFDGFSGIVELKESGATATKKGADYNRILDALKQAFTDVQVVQTAALLVIDGFHYGPNAQTVILDQLDMTPVAALNENFSWTKEQINRLAVLHHATMTGIFDSVLPPTGLMFNTGSRSTDSLLSEVATRRLANLTTLPPVRGICPDTGRDAYIFGATNFATDDVAKQRLTEHGYVGSKLTRLLHAAQDGALYRLCMTPDMTWMSLTNISRDDQPILLQQAADSLRATPTDTSDCPAVTFNPLVPSTTARCLRTLPVELNGDAVQDWLLLYMNNVQGKQYYVARALLSSEHSWTISDVDLTKAGDGIIPPWPAFDGHGNLNGRSGEEVLVRHNMGDHSNSSFILTVANGMLTLVTQHSTNPEEGGREFIVSRGLGSGDADGFSCVDVDSIAPPEVVLGHQYYHESSGDWEQSEKYYQWDGATLKLLQILVQHSAKRLPLLGNDYKVQSLCSSPTPRMSPPQAPVDSSDGREMINIIKDALGNATSYKSVWQLPDFPRMDVVFVAPDRFSSTTPTSNSSVISIGNDTYLRVDDKPWTKRVTPEAQRIAENLNFWATLFDGQSFELLPNEDFEGRIVGVVRVTTDPKRTSTVRYDKQTNLPLQIIVEAIQETGKTDTFEFRFYDYNSPDNSVEAPELP